MWLRAVGRQLSFPEGRGGRILGAVMDLANRQPVGLALDLLDAAPGERIIDIGCGTGAASQRLLRRATCTVTCVDRSQTMLYRAERRRFAGPVSLHQAHLGELPFANGSFDAALALNLLYFCDESGSMLADLKRVLRPGGRIVAYVTHRETMAKWPFVSPATHRLYDAGQLTEALTIGGFAADRIEVRDCMVNRHVRGLLALAIA
jgi:ubiquinone/menaquinone biosynthesis C-methylase UbiE